MTVYEVIDAVCDSVNPILFFVAIGLVIKDLIKQRFRIAGATFGLLLVGLFMVYGVFFLDKALGLWRSFGGDYSTHTAFAIAVCISISLCANWTKVLITLLFVYMALMLYQQYHSIMDIITTSIVIGIPLWVARILLYRSVVKTSFG